MNDTENKKTEVPVETNALPAPSVFNRNLNEETIHTDASASTLAEFLIHQDEYVERMKERQDFAGEKEEEHKKLFDKLKTYMHDEKSLDLIEEAYELAEKAHAGQTRQTGEPYIIHPVSVAYILAELEMDKEGVMAALLHDVVEDTGYTLEDLKMLFGEEVAFLVDGVTIRQAILRGEMEPGERLMEIQLAQKLGVSRTPIREAIRKLELEGLVIMIPRKGAEVAHITEKDMKDVLEVRSTLEELVVELAIKNVTDEKIEELKCANKVFESAIVSKDAVNIVEADVKFHDILYSMTNNARLIQIINNLREQMYRYRLEYVKDARTHSIIISEHNDIIKQIRDKNVPVAKTVIHQHISNQEKGISRLLNH